MGCQKLDISQNYESVLTVVGKNPITEKLQVERFWKTKKMGVNYYPFGSSMPGRSFNSSEYRYGFNGYEKDDEVKNITGGHISFNDYGYDPRTGKRWNVDPKTSSSPWQSPYLFAANSPIQYIDKDGEHDIYYMFVTDASTGTVAMTKVVVENTNYTHRVHYQIHTKDKDGNISKKNVTREQYAIITNQFIAKGIVIKVVPSSRIEKGKPQGRKAFDITKVDEGGEFVEMPRDPEETSGNVGGKDLNEGNVWEDLFNYFFGEEDSSNESTTPPTSTTSTETPKINEIVPQTVDSCTACGDSENDGTFGDHQRSGQNIVKVPKIDKPK